MTHETPVLYQLLKEAPRLRSELATLKAEMVRYLGTLVKVWDLIDGVSEQNQSNWDQDLAKEHDQVLIDVWSVVCDCEDEINAAREALAAQGGEVTWKGRKVITEREIWPKWTAPSRRRMGAPRSFAIACRAGRRRSDEQDNADV